MTRKADFLNNPAIIHYFLPASHFPKEFHMVWVRFKH